MEAALWDEELVIPRLNVLERQGRHEEYLRLARAAGQVEGYATMLVRLGRVAEAVDYGLEQLARTDDALALVAFEEELSLAAYLRAQELAGEGWPTLQPELLDRVRKVKAYYPEGPVDIFLHEGFIEDAMAAVNDGATHTLVERVVDAAMELHPDWVIEACRRQAEPIMNEGKAQYYGAAARWLGKARNAYRATGREKKWWAYLEELLAQHGRKYKLVPMLKSLK